MLQRRGFLNSSSTHNNNNNNNNNSNNNMRTDAVDASSFEEDSMIFGPLMTYLRTRLHTQCGGPSTY